MTALERFGAKRDKKRPQGLKPGAAYEAGSSVFNKLYPPHSPGNLRPSPDAEHSRVNLFQKLDLPRWATAGHPLGPEPIPTSKGVLLILINRRM